MLAVEVGKVEGDAAGDVGFEVFLIDSVEAGQFEEAILISDEGTAGIFKGDDQVLIILVAVAHELIVFEQQFDALGSGMQANDPDPLPAHSEIGEVVIGGLAVHRGEFSRRMALNELAQEAVFPVEQI